MASFTERIRLVFDVDGNPATVGFGKFAKGIREADGLGGKLKATFSGLNQAGSAFAVVLGGAVLRSVMKGVGAFEELAKKSIDLGKATGLSTEEASRWVAVADDVQVSAEQLQTSFGKVAKSLESAAWGKYGIETHDAGGNVRDMNDILVDTFSQLSDITDGTARAQAGTELFGKGWANIAPMVGHTREEYEKMLATVSDGQVITDTEAAKAEKLRLAQDRLADATRDFSMALGEMAAAGTPALNVLSKVVELSTKGYAGLSGGDAESIATPLRKYKKAAEEAGDVTSALVAPFGDLRVAVFNALSTVDRLRHSGDEIWLTKRTFNDLLNVDPAAAGATLAMFQTIEAGAERGSESMKALSGELGINKDSVAAMTAAYQAAGGPQQQAISDVEAETKARKELAEAAQAELDAKNDLINSQLGLSGANRSYQDSLDALTTTVDDAKTSQDEHAGALDDAAGKAIALSLAYVDQEKKLAIANGTTYDAKKATDDQVLSLEMLAAGLAPDSELRKRLEEYITTLTGIPTSIRTAISFGFADAGGLGAGHGFTVQAFAGGTNNAPGGTALVGEKGPELVNLPAGSQVIPADRTAAMLNGGPTAGEAAIIAAINASAKATARAVVQAMRAA